jgi:hypothetical protein
MARASNICVQQTALDSQVPAIEHVISRFQKSVYGHLTLHSDSASTITSGGQTGHDQAKEEPLVSVQRSVSGA